MYIKDNEIQNLTLTMHLESFHEPLFVKYSNFEQTITDSLDSTTEKVVVLIFLVSFAVGTYFKAALYQHMYDQGKHIIDKPIDILILVQALVDHLATALVVINFTIGLMFDITFSEYLGEAWCYTSWYSSVFGFVYRIYSGLGIAILRLFYIKSPHYLKDNVLRMRLVIMIMVCSLAITALVTIGYGTGNGQISRRQVGWNFCIGKSEGFREVVHNYSEIRGTVKPVSDFISKIAVMMVLPGIVAEIICYILFFHYLYSHNERLLSRNVLTLEKIKQRHRENAITFCVQFYNFVVETALALIIGYTMQDSSNVTHRLLFSVCCWSEFGVLSVVEVMLSGNLRQKLPHNRYFP